MAAVLFMACSGASIEGSWVEPVPGMEHMLQGIKIESGGKASSINMATLQYETWESKDGKLILTGKSIGNHRTLSFTDTLMIEKLTQDSFLILSKGDLCSEVAFQYHRYIEVGIFISKPFVLSCVGEGIKVYF